MIAGLPDSPFWHCQAGEPSPQLRARIERISVMLEELTGKNVLVRTVTHYYTGVLAAVQDGFLQLDEAAWIADTGYFSEALKKGTLNEVEPYPGKCFVAAGAVVDVSHWAHDLPRTRK